MGRMPTHYDILGIDPSASKEEIVAAYRKEAMETHPDRHPDKNAAEFVLVQKAYEVLGNSTERRRYDASLVVERVDQSQVCPKCGGNLVLVTDAVTGTYLEMLLEGMRIFA